MSSTPYIKITEPSLFETCYSIIIQLTLQSKVKEGIFKEKEYAAFSPCEKVNVYLPEEALSLDGPPV